MKLCPTRIRENKMKTLSNLKIEAAVANWSEAMEADTISKNGRNPKSQMSRGNLLKIFTVACFISFTYSSFAQEKSSQENYNSCMKKDKTELLDEMRNNNVESYWVYSSAINTNKTGNMLIGAGAGLALISVISFSAAGNAAEKENIGGTLGGVMLGRATMIVSIACLVGGIPTKIVGVNQKKRALMDYCKQQYSTFQSKPHFQINLNSNSVGFAYKF